MRTDTLDTDRAHPGTGTRHLIPTPALPVQTAPTATESITEAENSLPATLTTLPYPLQGIDLSNANEKLGTSGGRAKFQIAVTRNGKVTMAVLLESTFDPEGTEMLRQRIFAARFAAAMQEGKTLDSETILEIAFGTPPELAPVQPDER